MASARIETFEAAELDPSLFPTTGGLLRFTTAGSVDDGKSTLIGRLLYDSKTVYEDQLASVRQSRVNRSSGPIDFSLLTDGLRAEREQGITIDVAYRYFSTPRRRFIIADTPGHEQYTRNMATGASTAHAAIVLVDASKGLTAQSRRHAFIARLLGIPHVVAAINKMDLENYSEETFRRIEGEFTDLSQRLGVPGLYVIPISALEGDNVVHHSTRMPWFSGPPLLEHLETLPVDDRSAQRPLRFPVQYVVRPDSRFRGFAGQIASGTLRPGTTVVALPSGVRTKVKEVVTYDGNLQEAASGSSVTVTLEDEIDLSRGDLLASDHDPASISRRFEAMLVWMHQDKLDSRKQYWIKHTTRSVRARVSRIRHRVDVNSIGQVPASELNMNDIAAVEIETSLPLFVDPYNENRIMGSFILIDPITNATVAAGMVERTIEDEDSLRPEVAALSRGRVNVEERRQRFGHSAAAVWVSGRPRLAEFVERTLFEQGWHVQLIRTADFRLAELEAVARAFRMAGMIAIFSTHTKGTEQEHAIRESFGPETFFDTTELSSSDFEAAGEMVAQLRSWRVTHVESQGD
ncbi:MAG: sulfate adenylyltransferase subunit CysN [Candidatus Korobacteraceae bacterium]